MSKCRLSKYQMITKPIEGYQLDPKIATTNVSAYHHQSNLIQLAVCAAGCMSMAVSPKSNVNLIT